jgi:hypothetical protein
VSVLRGHSSTSSRSHTGPAASGGSGSWNVAVAAS